MARRRNEHPLYEYYQEKLDALVPLIGRIGTAATNGNVHRARVLVKNIRAMHRFMHLLAGDAPHAQLPDPFAKLFDQAGELRESQLIRKRLKGSGLPGKIRRSFIADLEKKEKRCRRQLQHTAVKFDRQPLKKMRQHARGSFARNSDAQIISAAIVFVREEAAIIRRLSAAKKQEGKKLHEIRKRLKAMLAVAALADHLRGTGSRRRMTGKLTVTEKLIGEWHDGLFFLEKLNKFLEKKTGGKTSPLVKNFLRRQEAEQRRLAAEAWKQARALSRDRIFR